MRTIQRVLIYCIPSVPIYGTLGTMSDSVTVTDIDTLLLCDAHTSFRYPSFLPNVPFLFQHLIQDATLHLVVRSP